MLFFRLALAVEKKLGLAEMIDKALAALTYFMSIDTLRVRYKTAILHHCLAGVSVTQRVRMVACLTLIDRLAHMAITLVVMHRHYRTVNGYLVEVGTSEADELCIGIREEPALHQRVVRKVDARYDVSDLVSYLLRLREEIIRVAVQCHLTDSCYRHQLFRHQLGRIQQVSWAEAACGISLSGSGFTEWIRSGNLMAS